MTWRWPATVITSSTAVSAVLIVRERDGYAAAEAMHASAVAYRTRSRYAAASAGSRSGLPDSWKVSPMDERGYPLLFGESGALLTDAEWVDHANKHLPPNLSALNTSFVAGSRADRSLHVAYEPGPGGFNYTQLSGGSIAEMLDQAATHCGSFVTSHPCPTLTMNVTFLRAGTARSYVAAARVIRLTSVSAVLGADLTDDEGHLVATVSLVSQLIKDLTRFS